MAFSVGFSFLYFLFFLKFSACSIYESSLFIDFSKNHFYAGILDDTDVYVISNNLNFNSKEFDSYPTEFLEWTKDALEIAKENK